MNRYCVGPTMAVDWGEEGPPPAVRRQMMWRVLSYFGPYRRAGLVVVGCIAVQAVLGLAPAVVFKALIDTLAHPHPSFARVGFLVAAGIGAALAAGGVQVRAVRHGAQFHDHVRQCQPCSALQVNRPGGRLG